MGNRIYVTASLAGGEPHLIFSGEDFSREETKALFHAMHGAHADGEFNLPPEARLEFNLIHEGVWIKRGDLDDGGVLRLVGEWTLAAESFERWGSQHCQPAPVNPAEYLSADNYWLYPIYAAAKRFGAEIVRRRGTGKAPTKAGSGVKRKRRKLSLVGKPLTTKQREAVEVVGRCHGNIAQAARELDVDPKTVRQHYEAGMAKLAQELPAKRKTPKTQGLPHNKSGQANIAEGDDKLR